MTDIAPPASDGRRPADSPQSDESGRRETPAARYAIDAEGRLLWVDDYWLSLLGYRRDEVIGRPVFDFLTSASRDHARLVTMVNLRRAGRIEQEPLQFTTRSGAILDVLLSMAEEDAEGDEISRCVGVIESLAALHHSESALLKERERLLSLIAGTQTGTWEWNTRTDEMRVNQCFADILGYTLGDLQEMRMAGLIELVHPDDRETIMQRRVKRHAGDRGHIEYELRMRHRDGHWVSTLIRGGVPTHSPDDGEEWIFGTMQDHSVLKAQEEALRRSQEFLARVERLARIGGWEKDLATGVAVWSDELCRIAGVPTGFTTDRLGNIRFIPDEYRQRAIDAGKEAKASGQEWDIELPFVRADGKQIWVHSTGRYEYEDGRPTRVTGTVQDITESLAQRRAIQEARDRIAVATDAGHIGIWDFDVVGNRFNADAWMCRLHGLPADTAHEFYDLEKRFMHPEDRARCRKEFEDALAGLRPFEFEYRIVRTDGAVRHIHLAGRVTRDGDNKPLRVIGALWDVTRQKEQEAALRKSQSFLARTGHMASIGGWEVDIATSHVNWSDETCRMHGMDIGATPPLAEVLACYSPEAAEELSSAMAHALQSGGNWEREVPFVRDGETRWFHVVGSVEFVAGQPVRHIGALQDVTEQRRHAEAMRRTLALQTAIFDSADIGIISTDRDGLITSFNHAAQRMLGYREEEMVGVATPLSFHDAAEVALRAEELSRELGRPVAPGFDVFVAHARRDISEQREWTYIRRDGTRFPVTLSVTALHDANHAITGFLGIAADISERKNAEQKLVHLANNDVLTGLPNRSSLRREAERILSVARRQKTSLATVFLDLDRFKEVNDSLGHETGDKLLQLVGMRLKACIRESDTVARLGGDEFVILLPGVSTADEVSIVTQNIQQKFAQPVRLSGHEIFVGVSMGISIFPDDGDDAMQLFRCADSALYQAKAEGRNNVQFYRPELTRRVEEKMQTLTALRHAITNKEFELHFQPIVSLLDATPVGAEALLRWRHPSRGLLAPDAFIGMAEESGLIVPIGEWVIVEACRTAVSIDYPRCANFSVSINVSARQFKSDHLVDALRNALRETGLDPQRLCLEITEQLLLNDSDRNAAMLRAIKALGVRISLDDFGTGYSSLSYIKRFSPDILKIDRSFVMDAARNPDDAAIIKAILAMANSLHIKVVAEGVENAAQRDFLLQQRCDLAQGYYYSRPVNGEDWRAWLAQRS